MKIPECSQRSFSYHVWFEKKRKKAKYEIFRFCTLHFEF